MWPACVTEFAHQDTLAKPTSAGMASRMEGGAIGGEEHVCDVHLSMCIL